MKPIKKTVMAVWLFLALLLSGCSLCNDGLTAEDAKAFLSGYREELDLVIDFLKELGNDSVFIEKGKEKAVYEFEGHDISSENVVASLRLLWAAGCRSIYKDDNTISFEIWRRTRGDVDCGIACTIDRQGAPKTQYQTRCEEIGDGWFYYYDDYEEYRKDSSKYEENKVLNN